MQNQGATIDNDEKRRIFDRFYRGDPAHNSEITGNGLGLSIAYQLATLNNIQITVTDVIPHGASFNLIFNN